MRRTLLVASKAAFISGAALFLMLPTLIVIPMSFSAADVLMFPPKGFSTRWYLNYFSAPEWRSATINSIVIALGAMTIATSLGTSAALGLSRVPTRFRGPLTIVLLVPVLVPAIITAVASYNSFARWRLSGSLEGMIFAHTALALPFVVIYVSAVLQRLDQRVVQAARSLGASPVRAFWYVTLPAIMPGVAVGAFFAFLTSFDEVVVSLFLSGNRAITLPVQMWNGIRFEINPTVAAVSVVVLAISSFVFLLVSVLRKKP
jgi:ABC-type spermidine/putrescine transport system permease subunit II